MRTILKRRKGRIKGRLKKSKRCVTYEKSA
jgi:hypothetical protein